MLSSRPGPIANFLLALVFFWVLAMLGSEQVRPVIGAVESGSIAAKAGLSAGQEIVSIDGEPVTGWAAVNLQLVRRLGESGSLQVLVREQGSTIDSPRELALDKWLKGAEEAGSYPLTGDSSLASSAATSPGRA